MIALFTNADHGATAIAAGSKCSLAITEGGQLYFWGQIKVSCAYLARSLMKLTCSAEFLVGLTSLLVSA